MTNIEQLLRDTAGFDAESVGPNGVSRAVRARMKALGSKQLKDYERLLNASSKERAELLELVVVTETWFFRDPGSCAALVKLVCEEWLPGRTTGCLRILSLPCSSGEEPYSIAMALLDAKVPPSRFRIEGVDISAQALERAARGVYRRNSFRGKELGFRERYFSPAKEGFVLGSAIRGLVHFSEGNLLAESFVPREAGYDVVFCRNLLIYFDRASQRRALERLGRLLAPEGVLFVGPAEQPLVPEHGFVSTHFPLASAFRKPDSPPTLRTSGHRPARLLTGTPTANETGAPPARWPQAPGMAAAPPRAAIPADLEQARRLADAGQLKEAAALCEAHLQQTRTSAYAYYLLGLVRDAAGDAGAVDYYRKALYLEPDHYESLVQMALLAEKGGDSARARTLRRRAERTLSQG